MKVSLSGLADLSELPFDDIIDVRSPSEFAEDHLPGAINLPVLDDAERARVGTLYRQVSPFSARVIGAGLVARNAANHIESVLADKPGDWRVLVYCWRGGQRSGSFASILAQIGWRIGVIDGGYRAFRRLVVDALHKHPLPYEIVVLDGNTGTAKTDLLSILAGKGAQIIDLEGHAGHRGSLFGTMPVGQPSQKQFEARIALALAACDPARPIVVEAESNRIGKLGIPPSLWAAMKSARRIEIAAPMDARASYLVQAYADMVSDPVKIHEILSTMARFHGHELVSQWRADYDAGRLEHLAHSLMVQHYDPRYLRSRSNRAQPEKTYKCKALDEPALQEVASRILGEL